MIEHLRIRNFATIENTEVDFEDGLNIITGETGAGKSIVIEAISLALGQRADNSLVRHGEDKATVELLATLDSEEFLIQREISNSGKNVCKLNGELVTLQQLNEKIHLLADIHGQYDNQSLLNPESHIELLDKYKKDQTTPLKNEVALSFHTFSKTKQELIKLLNLEKENARKNDFYRFEIDEINKINPKIDEDNELEEKISILNNSEKIFENIEKAYSLLCGEENSALSSLVTSTKLIEEVSNFSNSIKELSEGFNDSVYKIKDFSEELRKIKESITFSPKELDDSIYRLNQLDDLKKKYGSSIKEVLEYKDKIEKELEVIENFDNEKNRLEDELVSKKKILDEQCALLSNLRKNIANELSNKIESELSELNFKDAKVEIRIDKLDLPQENGIDKVEIYITTNKGEPLKPLYKVVSGGEMSRIMLAFKDIVSEYDNIPTLIFDEIDNGISGQTASIVGTKLKQISNKHQIICITHLPQIASKGTQNYGIVKENDDSKTYTQIKKLNREEKINEIARLIGGTTITDTTIKSAIELIESN